MKQINWFERKFDFSSTQNIFPLIMERLTGTPLRIKDKLSKINPPLHTLKPDNKWSILEHIGHLTDLETLWQIRLNDILEGKELMQEADLSNRKTDEANHNAYKAEDLVENFKLVRHYTITRLETLSEEQIFMSALHPRLKTPMRIMDLFLFVADHDDHHLAYITQLNKSLQENVKGSIESTLHS